jgi:hypothetical protein
MVHWLTLLPAFVSGLFAGLWLARLIRPKPPATTGFTFWGYTSGSQDGVYMRHRLPTGSPPWPDPPSARPPG